MCCFHCVSGQAGVFEDVEGKILQHIGTLLFHLLCLENIHGMCAMYKKYRCATVVVSV